MRERLADAEDQKNGDPKFSRSEDYSTFLAEGMDILLDMDEHCRMADLRPGQNGRII